MFITRASATYICEKCGTPLEIAFQPSVPDISTSAKAIEQYKQCTKCGGIMVLEKASLKALIDKYGDPKFGSWKCPIHFNDIYYPIPLKNASENTLVMSGIRHTRHLLSRYMNIASTGFPWKCPLCNKELKYIDDRFD